MPRRSSAVRTLSGVSPGGTLNLIVPLFRSIAVSTPYGGLTNGSPSSPCVNPPRPKPAGGAAGAPPAAPAAAAAPRPTAAPPAPPPSGDAPAGKPAAAPAGKPPSGAAPRPSPRTPPPRPNPPRPRSPLMFGGGSASQIGMRFFACASGLTVARYCSLIIVVVTDELFACP